MRLNRRESFGVAALLLTGAEAGPSTAQTYGGAADYDVLTISETQQGDPELTPETVIFDAIGAQAGAAAKKAVFRPRAPNFPKILLQVAGRYADRGVTRKTAEPEITAFLRAFNLGFTTGNRLTPFCAAGVASAAAIAYLEMAGETITPTNYLSKIPSLFPDLDHHHFFPSPSVVDMFHVAQGKHRWVAPTAQPHPGWLVVYDWKKNGAADHVGIVESATATTLRTIEFNTTITHGSQRDGGAVARKQRVRDATVKGFINTALRTHI